jgi:hypothetical protein
MDITPALNIYEELSLVHDRAEEFFRKYSHRIFFGTDSSNNLVGDNRELSDRKKLVTDYFFSGKEPAVVGKKHIVPLRLDEETLQNIYYNSAMRFIGEPID